MRNDDHFVRFAAAGLAIMFGSQAAINIAVNIHLIPAKGMTLPFISYGGSSMISLAYTHRHAAGLDARAAGRGHADARPVGGKKRGLIHTISVNSMAGHPASLGAVRKRDGRDKAGHDDEDDDGEKSPSSSSAPAAPAAICFRRRRWPSRSTSAGPSSSWRPTRAPRTSSFRRAPCTLSRAPRCAAATRSRSPARWACSPSAPRKPGR